MYQNETIQDNQQQKRYYELVSVLDMSGSMYSLKDDTIGGYNSFIESMKEKKDNDLEIYVTLVLFESDVTFVYKRKPIQEVEKIDDKVYHPGGCTALQDALGQSISYLDQVLKTEYKENDIVVPYIQIITDGMSNSDKEYSLADIKKMITERQEKKWEFIFAASNIDSFQTGENFGIRRQNIAQMNNRRSGQTAAYRGLQTRMMQYDMQLQACSRNDMMMCAIPQTQSFQDLYDQFESSDESEPKDISEHKQALILDVRTGDYNVDGHYIYGTNIPVDLITEEHNLALIEHSKEVICYCMRSKQRARYAAYQIKSLFPDKQVYVVDGGYERIKQDLPQFCRDE